MKQILYNVRRAGRALSHLFDGALNLSRSRCFGGNAPQMGLQILEMSDSRRSQIDFDRRFSRNRID